MKMTYRLVGYDRQTEKLVESHLIPEKHITYAKRVARFSSTDPDDIGDAPLNSAEARDIAGTIGATIDTQHRDYFLEPYSEPAPVQKRVRA